MTQDQAFEILKTGVNVFLTGEPGSGKTFLVNRYAAYLRKCSVDMAVTGSTGIAATHINGTTIHSWSGIKILRCLTKQDLNRLKNNKYIVKRINKARVLLIDEVSMLEPEVLTMVDQVCRELRQDILPFGGMQVILSGDFFQLPPVKDKTNNIVSQQRLSFVNYDREDSTGFAYESTVWAETKPVICYLTEQHRQEDTAYLSILSSIRYNKFTDNFLRLLKSRAVNNRDVPINIPRLYSHNKNVDDLNYEALKQINKQTYAYSMSSYGIPQLVEVLKKCCLSPERLELKVGALVMFTKNNIKAGFVNGTIGKVVYFDKSSRYPVVRLNTGAEITVEPMEWTFDENDRVLAEVNQIPLRLAWAITIHKSQGMTLDTAVVDLSGVFEYGQGYVALSRVRTLAGLYLISLNEKTFQVNPKVLAKDQEFRLQSELAVQSLSSVS